jgi:hypothetical protein
MCALFARVFAPGLLVDRRCFRGSRAPLGPLGVFDERKHSQQEALRDQRRGRLGGVGTHTYIYIHDILGKL